MDKKQARKLGLSRRKQLSESERSVCDERIFQKLCILLSTVNTVGVYVSYGSEADTTRIIEWCLDHHKTAAVPKVLNHTLEFHHLAALDRLKPGMKGILEPTDEAIIPLSEIDAMLVPLSAFDSFGNRTGYGLGYYDSVLNMTKRKIGIGYQVQQVDHIECDPWDVRLDEIISD